MVESATPDLHIVMEFLTPAYYVGWGAGELIMPTWFALMDGLTWHLTQHNVGRGLTIL
jgi:hypothetical protein